MQTVRGLDGRVIVVAGAARSIGRACAQRLGEEGAKVVVGDINLEGAEGTASSIVDAGGTAIAVQYDQSDEASVDNLIKSAVDHFGSLDGLHANAVDTEVVGRDLEVSQMDVAVWERTLRVGLIGYATAIRSALPHLLARGGGPILCTSSDAEHAGEPTLPAYAAAKAGVCSLVRHTASRWGREGIRANAICPFAVTDIVREHVTPEFLERSLSEGRYPRLGEPSDIAGAAAFLLSDDGAYANGQVFSINGGMYLRS
jgi:NAD(P)-dependent dehydrogenase (short-subunit alcohol dehydrogenase family)